ncbi:MAG: hypothetical protein KAT69_03215 [Candidatus Aminicenantes bacterium]|nr:hypothetical protein [Candidatus Aminicenantes bacterium]
MADMKIDIRSDVHQAPEDLREVNQALDVMEQKAEQAGKKLKMIGDRASAIGKKMTLFITAPLLAAGGAAIKLAMDAEESRNLFEISMGGMVDVAEKWSEQLSDSLGINRFESQKLIGVFNVMLKSLGQNEKAAYDMSKGLTELGYDMASFFNLEPEEAFDKLRAAITGETEPLKRLGIVVNETTIKTWALNNGMIKQGETLDESQKILARYNVIMEATSLAQGDMGRTLDSPTNKLRVLKSRVTETTIEFGMKMMPVFEDLLNLLEKGVKWFGSLSDASMLMVIKIAAVAAATGPLLIGLGKLLVLAPKIKIAITAMTGPFGILVMALAAAGAAIDHFLKKSIEKSDAEIAAMIEAGATHKDFIEMRKALFAEEILSVEEFKEIYEKHGRNYKRVMKAIATLPEYAHLKEAWKGMKEDVGGGLDELKTKIELLPDPIKIVILNLKELSDTIELRLIPSIDEVLEGIEVVPDTYEEMAGASDEFVNDLIASTVEAGEATGLTQEQTKKGLTLWKKDQLKGLTEIEAGIVSFLNVYESGMEGILDAAKRWAIAEAVKWIMAQPYPFPAKLIMAASAIGGIEAIYKAISSLAEGGIVMSPQLAEVGHGKGEAIIPLEKLPQVVKEVTKETVTAPIAITIIVNDQIDPYSAQRITRETIIPEILEALDANHMKKIWQKRLGVD